MTPWLIALAGLPASGKSTIARELARALPGALLDKDVIRAALFAPGDIEYSPVQDDFCMEIMLQAARYLSAKGRHVLLDGRPFSKRYQVERLAAFARDNRLPLKLIEAVCPDDVVRARLEQDIDQGTHPARNRTYAMYLQVKAQAEPITLPRLVIDTTRPLEELVTACLEYIHHSPEQAV